MSIGGRRKAPPQRCGLWESSTDSRNSWSGKRTADDPSPDAADSAVDVDLGSADTDLTIFRTHPISPGTLQNEKLQRFFDWQMLPPPVGAQVRFAQPLRIRIIVNRHRPTKMEAGRLAVSMSCRFSKNEGLAPLIFPRTSGIKATTALVERRYFQQHGITLGRVRLSKPDSLPAPRGGGLLMAYLPAAPKHRSFG